MSRSSFLGALVEGLRQQGLDAQLTDREDRFDVGTTHRGALAAPAVVRVRPGDVDEYLRDLGEGWDGDDPRDHAFGMLVMLLVEALSTVHDGENNFVTEVELRRGLQGRLGLHETRIESGVPLLPPDEVYGWSPEP